jgi:hypothetical protein
MGEKIFPSHSRSAAATPTDITTAVRRHHAMRVEVFACGCTFARQTEGECWADELLAIAET